MHRRQVIGWIALPLASCGTKYVPVEESPRKIHVSRPNPVRPVESDEPPPPSDTVPAVEWTTLRGLNTRTGEASPLLELIAGTAVKIAGYMVPLDDDFQEVNDFLLVPTAGACIHTPPPPGNQIIYAQMANGRPAKVELSYAVWAYGRLEISSTDSPYGAAGFRLAVTDLKRRT